MKLERYIGEVVSIKLTSGEELITKILSVEDDEAEISDPLSVAPNAQGMGLVPSIFTADQDKNVRLNTNMITMYCETTDAVRMKYIEATTGIATTSKKIVLG
jgi:hypothetical protein